eukprot:g1459.t1
MSSRVHFRFSSSTDFDFVLFNGDFITVGELKYLISKKTGVLKDRNTVIELFDSRTEDEYKDASTMIAKNASVIAKRSPAVKAPIISTVGKPPLPPPQTTTTTTTSTTTPTPITTQDNVEGTNVDDEFGPDAFAPDVKSNEDDAAISELVKGFGEVWRTDLNAPGTWGRGRGTRGRDGTRGGAAVGGRKTFLKIGRPNLPPFGYICHRCNIPGHFIDECPTNGDPAYDFVRVRYPTGIPATMLVKDDQGGLLMPNGERARLRPNTEKFKQEMEGVPGGDNPSTSSMKLTGVSDEATCVGNAPPLPPRSILDNKQLEELSVLLCNNPLSSITPLVMNVLPTGRDSDLHKGFFNGVPFDEQSFQKCKEEFHRAKALFEENSRPNSPTTTTTTTTMRRDPNSNITSTTTHVTTSIKDHKQVGQETLSFKPRQSRSNWESGSYQQQQHPSIPSHKSVFHHEDYYHHHHHQQPNMMNHAPHLWHGNVHQPIFDPYYSQQRYPPVPPQYLQMPQSIRGEHLMPPQRTIHSEAVRIQHPGEPDGVYSHTLPSRTPSPKEYKKLEAKTGDLPYGFGGLKEERREERYRSVDPSGRTGMEEDYRGSRSRSRSHTQRGEELRTSEDGYETSKRKSRRKHDDHHHHSKSRKKRHSSENSTPRVGSTMKGEDGLDRWKLEDPLSNLNKESRLDQQQKDEVDSKSRKKRRSDRRSIRDSYGKDQE